jgi:hypothetical protein
LQRATRLKRCVPLSKSESQNLPEDNFVCRRCGGD